ncbi:hypothetical protein CBE37_01300 [bacterium TMED277]|nr:MAG: hypothetical protein CBE37_01300 [bacterium TMED277]
MITIFGGSGFLGRYIVHQLGNLGFKIRVVVRKPNNAIFLKVYGKVGQIEIVRGDISNSDSLKELIGNAEIVINCVAIFYETNNQKFKNIHVNAAGKIAETSKLLGVKQLIHISSLGAKSASKSALLKTKGEGEEKVLKIFPNTNIIRPSLIFGPEDDFFNRFARMALISPVLPSIGSETKFQPVFVDDVAKAVTFLVKNKCEKRYLELGGQEVFLFVDLLRKLLVHINRKRIILRVPLFAAKVMALINDFLRLITGNIFPAFLTVAQVKSFEIDNICGAGLDKFEDLGIEPKGLDIILPTYLNRFRKKQIKE